MAGGRRRRRFGRLGSTSRPVGRPHVVDVPEMLACSAVRLLMLRCREDAAHVELHGPAENTAGPIRFDFSLTREDLRRYGRHDMRSNELHVASYRQVRAA